MAGSSVVNATGEKDAPSSAEAAIQNVIFDMGGVLMRFSGIEFAREFTSCEDDARALDAALFSHPSWALLDAGAIDEDTMERVSRELLPERLHGALHECLHGWWRHRTVVPGTNELVARLHDAGYGCYLLSNAGTSFMAFKDSIPAFSHMDGWLVSSFVRLMKPDPRIYHMLAGEYGLDPARCLFVDDNADNVRGARAAGMHGHLFTDVGALERDLLARGLTF
jgi:putative hydrolase of the HAD superfamily